MTATDPPLKELADDHDEDGWDRAKHGKMADHATPDTTVPLREA